MNTIEFKLENGTLSYGKVKIFGNVPEFVTLNETVRNGVFVNIESDRLFFDKIFTIGTMPEMERFELCYRTQTSCWMEPMVGTKVSEMPEEIQYLMAKIGKMYFAFYALIDRGFRSCFEGSYDGILKLLVQSGDTHTKARSVLGFYIGVGENPYQLVEQAAKQIQSKLGAFKLRIEKDIPEFTRNIGWCTYNAFYDKYTDIKITSVLNRFNENNFHPGFILLDDGWQNRSMKERSMTSFIEDHKKFPNGLKSFIDHAKEEYGVRDVIIWHAFCGWWAGIKKENFRQYGAYNPPIHMFERYLDQLVVDDLDAATVGKSFYPQFMLELPIGLPDDMIGFYNDFYAYLKEQGVDGTKLDAMTWMEVLGEGMGGRVAMMKKLNESLETASSRYFKKQLINCSSCSNDMVFQSMDTNIIRSSCDYFPERPETHGKHIFINAHTSLWLGEFLLPDWDMFQSGNTAGDYHAAARAISGGPVYVTDTYQMENYDILHKLCYLDGRLPMCTSYAKVCEDSLFLGIEQQEKAIKVFNNNRYGGMVGAFNCAYNAETHPVVSAGVKPSDINGLKGDRFAVYGHQSGELHCVGFEEEVTIELEEFGYEVFTIMPLEKGFAPVGLIGKYNAGATLEGVAWQEDQVTINLGECGSFIAYCDRPVSEVLVKGKSIAYSQSGSELKIKSAPQNFTVNFN